MFDGTGTNLFQDTMPGPEKDSSPLSGLTGKRVYIETYGCRYNFGDSQKLSEILRQQGCSRAGNEHEADAVIVNTCTVVEKTERRMLRRLAQLCGHDLYVTGCMAVVQQEAILSVCTPRFIPPVVIQEKYRRIRTVAPDPVGIVQIARGCTSACTYCITRKARGPLHSETIPEILDQIAAFEQAGAYEIQLTAQDTGAWGRDCGQALPDLLHAIGGMQGRFCVRVGMMNPATVLGILDDLVDAYSEKNIFSFLHVPVQSGSDRVLRRMGRGYSVADFMQIIAAFTRRHQNITVATDMITGFPGETEADFQQSLDLVRRMRFSKVNVTRYSRRPHTPAFYLEDTPGAVKKDRSRILEQCARRVSAELHSRFVGQTLPFTVTEKIRKGSVMARTDSYAGIVLAEDLPIGSGGLAAIRQGGTYFLKGKRIVPS